MGLFFVVDRDSFLNDGRTCIIDIVQVKNPKTGHYVKIDRSAGRILDQKKSDGPYKGIPVARKRG